MAPWQLDTKEEPDVPREITSMGCFSAILFLYLSILFLLSGKYARAVLVFLLYVSTCLHWEQMKNGSQYHLADLAIVACVVLSSIYIGMGYSRPFMRVYLSTLFFGGLVYFAIKQTSTIRSRETHYAIVALHISVFHILIPLVYLWGFLRNEIGKTPNRDISWVSERLFGK